MPQLELTLIYQSARYHGEEWPPNPMRLYQALVNTTFTRMPGSDKRIPALQWLEGLQPPIIEAARARRSARCGIRYLPDNDNRFDHRHMAEWQTLDAWVWPIGQGWVRYVWDFDAGTEHAATIEEIAHHLRHLGRSEDLVVNRTDAPGLPDGVIYRPQVAHNVGRWLIPRVGALKARQAKHAGGVNQVAAYSKPVAYTTSNMLVNRAPVTVYRLPRVIGDANHPSAAAHYLRSFALAGIPRLTRGYDPEMVSQLVAGHNLDESFFRGPHLMYAALPNLGHRHADGLVRRVAIIGEGCEEGDARGMYDDLIGGLRGKLDPVKDSDYVTRLYTRTTSTIYASATPVILPGFPRRKTSIEDLVVRALGHSGIEGRDIADIWARSMKLEDKMTRQQGKLACRVQVQLQRPLETPMAIGQGRYMGLGMMIPLTQVSG